MLFKIEGAVLTGITHPTCTMEKSNWNVPSNKKNIKPGRVSEFIFKQEKYSKNQQL